ncbi:GNAT family N-acetyltransferase [Flavobacterium sp.]|uniref:GNAT family N-acetyltransferase n=1 Tax=Flavobacterium sp. TaxID=239 RepID=UPI002B4B00C5|nr:GNAT family N-acetyltransferase [Flavobacterium sp.]HLP64777.1 GNAT family N-acetyltransferase [Flavobacterium sp.]
MEFREAISSDLEAIMDVRFSVKENVLSNPDLVTIADCEDFIFRRGKGWVCVVDEKVVGFSIVDLVENNIWALFVRPEFAQQGIGKQLHNLMLDWYFSQTHKTVWLGTDPGTRAEAFYRKSGWQHIGMYGNEYKFEMTYSDWNQQNNKV